jgi:hypothetical protein
LRTKGDDEAAERPGYSQHVSVVSWVNGLADRALARSTWGRYPLGVRVLTALSSWALGVVAGGLMLVLLKAPRAFVIIYLVTVGVWFGALLAANVTGSRSLMRISIWGAPILALMPIGLVAAIQR